MFVDALSDELLARVASKQTQNPTKVLVKETVGEMLPETRSLLTEFYRPYNEMVVSYFNDSRYSWNAE